MFDDVYCQEWSQEQRWEHQQYVGDETVDRVRDSFKGKEYYVSVHINHNGLECSHYEEVMRNPWE